MRDPLRPKSGTSAKSAFTQLSDIFQKWKNLALMTVSGDTNHRFNAYNQLRIPDMSEDKTPHAGSLMSVA